MAEIVKIGEFRQELDKKGILESIQYHTQNGIYYCTINSTYQGYCDPKDYPWETKSYHLFNIAFVSAIRQAYPVEYGAKYYCSEFEHRTDNYEEFLKKHNIDRAMEKHMLGPNVWETESRKMEIINERIREEQELLSRGRNETVQSEPRKGKFGWSKK